ncbi:hypothetical protein [Argonema antarcticum]|uniref:hypothetical protein n=1 Tax=Argonema antarcticum TaxID=2942763 RepID=UPI002012CFE2|nr:hypothetical protein [Argonema antarcticum]MCL1475101.1 hypothetical protein [Argonema antarcticum A004/B2]
MRDYYNRYSNEQQSLARPNPLTKTTTWILQNWNGDATAISGLGLGLIYLAVKEPVLITIILSTGLLFYCLNRIIHFVPSLNRLISSKIRFWHVAAIIMAITITFGLFEMPAGAVFLSGLEAFVKTLAQQSASGGGQAVSDQAVTLVFNLIRAVFLILVGVAALFAYNQAQQGNDWRPIATQAGLAIGIVLAIDVITFLFIGDGTGGTGGA